MEIEQNAPAVTRQERIVSAPPERVFQLLADVAAWPEWQPHVRRSRVESGDADGGLGTTFVWRSGGVTITSTIGQWDRPRAIGWTGRTIGTRAVHVWSLEPVGADQTLVRTEESMSGWLPRVLTSMTRRTLEDGVRATLDALVEAV